ncbi:hypothetical protein TNCV_4072611 [Trichonephila clavipes]|uniref:Uncharacterized protein n=1 Tax=Trichonephila clavipes TaxID=2585209 RepID=A0A8X6W7V2_TRICX|nr:hypothetical protein TNCV_4072611 [Trichonephila clavipes]
MVALWRATGWYKRQHINERHQPNLFEYAFTFVSAIPPLNRLIYPQILTRCFRYHEGTLVTPRSAAACGVPSSLSEAYEKGGIETNGRTELHIIQEDSEEVTTRRYIDEYLEPEGRMLKDGVHPRVFAIGSQYLVSSSTFRRCQVELLCVTSSHVNWADIENCVEFLLKEMPAIKIDNNCLFEEILKTVKVYSNSDKSEQWKN